MMMKHVAVLKGGWSAEREVSLNSGAAVEQALAELGYQVTAIDVQHDIFSVLEKLKPDVVFNALHGRYGEDGCIQGVLEILEIPYTHSGLCASAAAMNKPVAKKIFQAAGIPISDGRVVSREEFLSGDVMARPYVIKPLNEGSSVGVRIVQEGDNVYFDEHNWPYGDYVLVERYVKGREIQVAVLEHMALGAIEIKPNKGFYDYEAKYTDGMAQHIMPAPLPQDMYDLFLELALKAHKALGCRGLSRSDFRYDEETGELVILETNTQPGMTKLSLAPEIAAHGGMSFNDLVRILVEGARLGE